MPCNCSKKSIPMLSETIDPLKWGSILWRYLHCLSENLGSGNTIVDADQANYIETIITSLHLILPCKECQGHTAAYISSNPFQVKGLRGEILRTTVRDWLFTFHNNVRALKGQPIEINTPEECAALYTRNAISKSEYALLVQSVATAVRQGFVRIDNWRKWYSNSERLRIIAGNIVI